MVRCSRETGNGIVREKSIIKRGHRAYCPMQKHILRGHRSSKGETVLLPLFPRYLFAECPEDFGSMCATLPVFPVLCSKRHKRFVAKLPHRREVG